MVQIIVWGIVLWFLCKVTNNNSSVSNPSFDNDMDDFIAMDLISDGEMDGDFHQSELNKDTLCDDVQWSAPGEK